ncbi:MAG: hypothetical protein NTY73_04380 [Candidatus Micrarchaeota archaeon]|nr:hypothetical protein [Candidatus Micrarchaeota archaeon]
MDRSAALSLLGLLLVIAVIASTISYNEFASRWQVDNTLSMVNSGNESVRSIIKPPEIEIVESGGKSIIIAENITVKDRGALFAENGFKRALESGDRLLLYTGQNGKNAVIVSSYFNDAEVKMLSKDERILRPLKNKNAPGTMNISYVEVSDPTNAVVETVRYNDSWVPILVPHAMSNGNLSSIESSSEFGRVIGDSMNLKNKSLLLYRPAGSEMSIVIPVNFTYDEVKMLAKNDAVKTAMEGVAVDPGEILNLEDAREFRNIDMARLPYEPNTKIYTSFNIRGELSFLSGDLLMYLAIFVVALVILHVLYTILVA